MTNLNEKQLDEQIITAIEKAPLSPGDIAQMLDKPLSVIIKALEELEEKGIVVEVPDRTDNLFFINK